MGRAGYLIKMLAKEIRKKAEKYAEDNGFEENLEGLCAITSFAFSEELEKNNILHDIVLGWNRYSAHCWIEIDRIVWDLTASQFKKPKIYNGEDIKENFPTRKYAPCRYYDFKDWENQRPLKRNVKSLLSYDIKIPSKKTIRQFKENTTL